MAFRLPYWEKGRVELWHPAFPQVGLQQSDTWLGDNWHALLDLFDWIQDGGLVEAHNASFERGIWANIMTPRYDWPEIKIAQWRCSAAKAAAHALPRGLDDAASALKLKIRKDAQGSKVMQKMNKPRKPRKAEREAGVTGLLWWETPALFEQLFAYCKQDVLTEEAVSAAVPDLSPSEQALYTLDQIINERGFQLDTEAVEAALTLIESETRVLNGELSVLTEGQVKKATQRAQMIEWFASVGLRLMDTQKETLDELLVNRAYRLEVPAVAWRGIELVRTLGRSSTAKYQAMQNHMAPDGRVRGSLLFHGASTGRWSGAGVQPHNFPKGSVKDQDALWSVLKTLNRAEIEAFLDALLGAPNGGVLEALSNGLRGAITATPGSRLYVADYAGIEARVVQWLADDQDALRLFTEGGDTYKDMAAGIYHIDVSEVSKDQRQLGKIAILGCGFGMGWSKFQGTCESPWGIVIDDDLAQQTVTAYREKFWKLVEEWANQQEAAIRATQTRKPVECGYVTWFREGIFLYCRLPSGRCLAYPYPEVRMRQTPWGEERPALTFMGINSYTRKWERQHTYGGSIVENIVQAIARDLLAESMTRLEDSGVFLPVLSVHDETICEGPPDADLAEFEHLMTVVPDWADGIPIAIEAWTGERYRK